MNIIYTIDIITKCMEKEFWCKNMCKLGGGGGECGGNITGGPKMRNNHGSIQLFIFSNIVIALITFSLLLLA